jgi:hypothetical protein
MLKLILLMLKEEVRLHTSFSHKLEFMLFPVMNFFFVLVCCLLSPQLLKNTPLQYFYYLMNSGIFVYGMFMGAFVFFGSEYIEKQFGKVSFLISTPHYHPLSFRKAYFAFFVHDVIFYFLFTLIPISLALLIATPIMGFSIVSVGLIILCATLAFILGISLSFFMANLYSLSIPAFAAFSIFLGVEVNYFVFFAGYEYLFPSYMFQTSGEWYYLAISLALPIILIILAEVLIQDKPPVRERSYRAKGTLDKNRFRIFKGYSILVAKEVLDVKRSKMLSKILFSYGVTLLILLFGSYMVRSGLNILMDFNLVFYGALVGFFGTFIYSFLNFTDSMDYYQMLPITVPQVIKAKLIVYLMLTTIVSTVFLLLMTFVTGEFIYLPLAFVVMIITTVYIAIVLAYLTGLRTNSYLFNTSILIKFNILATLPLAFVMLISFILGTWLLVSLTTILAICVILIIITYVFYKRIDTKWGNESFSL